MVKIVTNINWSDYLFGRILFRNQRHLHPVDEKSTAGMSCPGNLNCFYFDKFKSFHFACVSISREYSPPSFRFVAGLIFGLFNFFWVSCENASWFVLEIQLFYRYAPCRARPLISPNLIENYYLVLPLSTLRRCCGKVAKSILSSIKFLSFASIILCHFVTWTVNRWENIIRPKLWVWALYRSEGKTVEGVQDKSRLSPASLHHRRELSFRFDCLSSSSLITSANNMRNFLWKWAQEVSIKRLINGQSRAIGLITFIIRFEGFQEKFFYSHTNIVNHEKEKQKPRILGIHESRNSLLFPFIMHTAVEQCPGGKVGATRAASQALPNRATIEDNFSLSESSIDSHFSSFSCAPSDATQPNR